jgi:hypothetical protein
VQTLSIVAVGKSHVSQRFIKTSGMTQLRHFYVDGLGQVDYETFLKSIHDPFIVEKHIIKNKSVATKKNVSELFTDEMFEQFEDTFGIGSFCIRNLRYEVFKSVFGYSNNTKRIKNAVNNYFEFLTTNKYVQIPTNKKDAQLCFQFLFAYTLYKPEQFTGCEYEILMQSPNNDKNKFDVVLMKESNLDSKSSTYVELRFLEEDEKKEPLEGRDSNKLSEICMNQQALLKGTNQNQKHPKLQMSKLVVLHISNPFDWTKIVDKVEYGIAHPGN